MKTEEIKEAIASAKKELDNITVDSVKGTIDSIKKSLGEQVSTIFGWSADYYFVEISHIDVLNDYQTYNIVDNKQIKVLIPEESVNLEDHNTILINKKEFGIREPNIMDIIHLKNRMYMVDNVSFKEDMNVYELTISKYQQFSKIKY